MPREGPRRLPARERDRRLAEEVLYLHSLWRSGPPAPAPAPAPIQSRSARREELDRRALRRQERERLALNRVLRRKERKRRRIDRAASALAPPPPASSRENLAEAAGASPAPPTANPPPPTTPPGPLAQREAVPSSLEFTNRDSAGDRSNPDGEKAEEQEAAAYFTGLFERDAWLRGHYTDGWRKGRFQCMVCTAGGGNRVGQKTRRFRGCLALVHHARDASRGRSLCGRYGRRGAHRALAAVVCRMLGWDVEKPAVPRVAIDARATAGVQHAKENHGAGKNNGFSTDDDSYSIDEDEESEDEESVDEEDIESGMLDPATDGDEEDSEIESNEEYAEKEDRENRMEDSSTDSDEDADELERSKVAGQKEAANSIARKQVMKMRNRLLSLTHAIPVGTTPKKMEVWKRILVPKHKEVSTPGIKFKEGSGKTKRKASALSYQGLKQSTSGVVKNVKVNQQPSNKGKQGKTNETGASARKAKRPAVAARKSKQLAKKQKQLAMQKQLAN